MSIRYLKLDNTVGELEKIEHLFDPRLNENYAINHTNRNWKDVLNFLNTLFCQTNIENIDFARAFLFSGRSMSEAERTWFIDTVRALPDDQRYLLAFMSRSGHINAQGAKFLNYRVVGVYDRTTSLSFETSQRAFYPHEAGDVSTVTFLNEIHDTYKDLFDTLGESVEWPITCLAITNTATLRLMQYHGGYKLFSTTTSHLTPAKLKAALDADPALQPTIEYDIGNREFNLQLIRKVSKTWREPLYKVLNYSSDATKILPWPLREAREQNPVLVGVELEVATDYDVKKIIDAADEPFFLSKQDGSITGNKLNRMELVTAPASFKYLKRQYALWFNNLEYDAFDVTTDTNNGMHVHIGREHFEDDAHIRNFVWFYNNPANLEFLMHISERTKDSLQRWAGTFQFSSETSRSKAFKTAYKIIANAQNKYSIVHFKGGWNGAKTLEVRMFKGIVSYASIVKNLEFVEATFEFTRGLQSYRTLTLKGFLEWLGKQPGNKYTLLRKHIKQIRNFNEMLIGAEIKDITFIASRPEHIAEKLNTSGLTITHEHISYLNKSRRRTYTLNKMTNKIEVFFANRSKLADFDKSFASRYFHNIKTKVA